MIKVTDKHSIPIAIIVAGLLIAGAVIFVNLKDVPVPTSQEKTLAQQIGEKALNFINENLLMAGITASLIEAVEEGSQYQLKVY